ncbi:MAG: hypothetical protein O2856_16345 [Planctomycetota bacterium]|nr:hypothetical protein [Planctomycetota bacterium]
MKSQISDVQHVRLQRVMEVHFNTMQITRVLHQHQEDLDSGNGRVWLPHALG